jgi:hypothetical protein
VVHSSEAWTAIGGFVAGHYMASVVLVACLRTSLWYTAWLRRMSVDRWEPYCVLTCVTFLHLSC